MRLCMLSPKMQSWILDLVVVPSLTGLIYTEYMRFCSNEYVYFPAETQPGKVRKSERNLNLYGFQENEKSSCVLK